MQDQTLCVLTPRADETGYAALTVPTHRASTIVFQSGEAYRDRAERGVEGYTYGLAGTPTTRALAAQITALEGGTHTLLLPSGQAVIMMAIMTLVSRGERLLLPDSVYPPARALAEQDLARLGVETLFYDPTDLADLRAKLGGGARLVWLESPGSTTMEMQDLAAVAEIAHAAGALVGCDNTWASPLNFKPLAHGADLVVEALTKYFSGHSDLLMGSITVKDEAHAAALRQAMNRFGLGVSPDDCALVLRGIQTMALRLRAAGEASVRLADWLRRQDVVAEVLHPALPGSRGHALWARDFAGPSGVFSLVLHPKAAPHLYEALDVLKLFSIGASWGGTHSLVAPMDVSSLRSCAPQEQPQLYLRLSIGLEAEEDLRADLERLCTELRRRAGL